MVSRAQRFLDAFNRIESHLGQEQSPNDWYDIGFVNLVREAKRLSLLQREQLQHIARLRNAIVHNKSFQGEPIAEPREDVVAWLEQQAEIIENPPRVFTVLNGSLPIELQEDDEIAKFLPLVGDNDYSQAPVRLKNGELSLLTTNCMARWLAKEFRKDELMVTRENPISEVLEHAEHSDRAVIRERDLTAVEAVQILGGEQGPPPAAILLTETGKEHQTVLRICTTTDLPALLKALGITQS